MTTSQETSTLSDLLPLQGLDGRPVKADELAGKVVLFVNVASRCGLTPQYEGLVALQAQKGEHGLVVVGVPCNQFAGQEPGASEEILSFCATTYGVDFPLLEKQNVNEPGRSPLYRWLVGSGAGGDRDVQWNFEKFLVNREGEVCARFSPRTDPLDPAMLAAVDEALSSGGDL